MPRAAVAVGSGDGDSRNESSMHAFESPARAGRVLPRSPRRRTRSRGGAGMLDSHPRRSAYAVRARQGRLCRTGAPLLANRWWPSNSNALDPAPHGDRMAHVTARSRRPVRTSSQRTMLGDTGQGTKGDPDRTPRARERGASVARSRVAATLVLVVLVGLAARLLPGLM